MVGGGLQSLSFNCLLPPALSENVLSDLMKKLFYNFKKKSQHNALIESSLIKSMFSFLPLLTSASLLWPMTLASPGHPGNLRPCSFVEGHVMHFG